MSPTSGGTDRRSAVGLVLAAIGLVLVAATSLLYLTENRPEAATVQPPPPAGTSSEPTAPQSDATVSPSKPTRSVKEMQPIAQAPPIRLVIPSIGVDAEVGEIATTTVDGVTALTPPEATWADLARAYWWNERQAPGNPTEGTTFILGHTCHQENCPSVFNRLQYVAPGATITLETRNGLLTYRVTRAKTYAQADVAGDPEVNKDFPQGLTLITCKLRADGAAQTDNYVVWAKLIDTRQK